MKHNWAKDEDGNPDEWAWESGFHNGVYCVDCGKCVCIHCDEDWIEMDDCPGKPPRVPMTNAKRIKNMSVDELAKFLLEADQGNLTVDVCNEKYCDPGHCKHDCTDAVKRWLESTVEE